jgi:gas vesicle protein
MAERSDLIRNDIERTRSRMDSTADALAYKANVPARTKGWIGTKKDAIVGAGSSAVGRVSNATDSMVYRVSGATPSVSDVQESVQESAGRVKHTAERNPLGLAVAGAAVGFVAGIFAPSTSVENQKLGAVADDVKSAAVEAGQEALQHGKEVAQNVVSAAADTAAGAAKDQVREHGEELTSSLQDKASSVGS